MPQSLNYTMISYRGSDLRMDEDLGSVVVRTVDCIVNVFKF